MKPDFIFKEELWRSIPEYFVSFLAIGVLILGGILPLPLSTTFLLALIPAAVHFLVMVRYRRMEKLTDPTITNILRHALRLEGHEDNNTKQGRSIAGTAVDAILVVAIFLIYLYASLSFSINQIFWLLALVVISILLIRIIFIECGKYRVTFVRWVAFFLIVSMIILLRYLVLGDPVIPTFLGLVLVGIVSIGILYIWEKRRASTGNNG